MMDWRDELDAVCRSWQGTPHVDGARMRGVGVDCVQFVAAVLDELYGLRLPPVPRLPPDLTLFDRAGAVRTAHAIASRYPNVVIRGARPADLEPGDVLVYRFGVVSARHQRGAIANAGHVLICGKHRGEAWHATSGAGVCRTAIVGVWGNVLRVWRPLNREIWKRRR